MDPLELKDKVSVVTGASRGIGEAIALKLSSLGCKVVVNHIASQAAEAAQVAEKIHSQGGEAMLFQADIRDGKAVEAMFRQVVDQWGKVDILVNNAGINRDMLLPRMPEEVWDDVINTNLRGAYLCTKFALRSMLKQGGGRIINISSVAGIIGNAGQTNYAASKSGLIGFTKSLAREVGSRNITVNAIAPGFITTGMTEKLPREGKELILSIIPLKRFGTPQDVAELVAFLASEKASYITGEVISIDGGM